jgi:hypothetical protein
MDFKCPRCEHDFSVDEVPIIYSCPNCTENYLLAFQSCFRRFDRNEESCNIKNLTEAHTDSYLISENKSYTNLYTECSCHRRTIPSPAKSIQFTEISGETKLISFYQVKEYINQTVYHGTYEGIARIIIKDKKLLCANHENNKFSVHSLPIEKDLVYLGLNKDVAEAHSKGSVLEFSISGWVIETNSSETVNQFLNKEFFESLGDLVIGVEALEGGGTLLIWNKMDLSDIDITHDLEPIPMTKKEKICSILKSFF